MANTNDTLKNYIEGSFKDYDVEVEGVGYALSPFKITLKNKVDGHEHVVYTSLTKDEVVARFNDAVKAHKK